MVKAVVENGVGATAISDLMVKKELCLSTLRSLTIIDNRNGSLIPAEITRPFLKLKHRQRFQSRLSIAFEQMLTPVETLNSLNLATIGVETPLEKRLSMKGEDRAGSLSTIN